MNHRGVKIRFKRALQNVALMAGMGALVVSVGYGRASAQSGGSGEQVAARSLVTISPQQATLRRRLRFQIVDRKDGLPLNTVSSIVQDRAGFMWLGTADGLARWDGQRFLTFRHDPANPATISASWVNEILLARDGTLWIGTEGGGVNRYRQGNSTFDRFEAANDPETLHSGSILSMSEGPDGRIWIGTQGGGLGVLDPATGKVRSYSTEDGMQPVVSAVLADDDGTVWVGTFSGLFRFDSKKKVFEPLFQENEDLAEALITTLSRDRKGDLWIGTDAGGLARYSPGTKKLELYKADAGDWTRLNHNSIKAVYEDRNGHIWVGTSGALHVLDPATGRFERDVVAPEDPRSLPDSPTDIYQDRAGVIWVATFNAGVALLDPLAPRFGNYSIAGSVSGLFLDDRNLWVATFQGICRWRMPGAAEGDCYKMGRATTVVVDRAGTTWLGTIEDGLYRLDPTAKDRWIVYRNNPDVAGSLAPGTVTALHEDRTGALWVGLLGGGLRRFDRSKEEFVGVHNLPSEMIYKVEDDPVRREVLWIGTADLGLLSLNLETGQILSFTPQPNDDQKKTDNAVVDFLFDGDRTIWLATYGGGLKRLDRTTGAFKTYRRTEGMPSDTLYAVRRDKSGNLWLSSVDGLARFDPRTGQVDVFTSADGLQADEFTLNAAVAADDGRFYFGGVDGFNVFRPEEIDIDRYRPPVVLTSIEVLGEPYVSDRPLDSIRRLSLDHDQAFVAVEFAALSFSGSKRFQFEYKVQESSDRWLNSNSGNISLAGLDSGAYTLVMRARNRHGVASDPIALAVVVAPPPWRTWWAYSAYGLAVLALLFAIYRYQQARIARLQKLARLATVEKEFEVTAAVQSWFLPEASRFRAGVCDLVGFYRAADTCSGDWWWYEDIGRGKLWVIVADVTGHGAGSAMVTAAVAMGLRVQAEGSQEAVIERLSRVNREVLFRCKGKATMTMTAVVLDQRTGEVVVYGLGGLPALLVKPEGAHTVIGASGTPLGSVERLEVGERTARLAPGDRLIITTDGIVETTMPGGRPLGLRRFVNVLREVRAIPLDQAVERIVRDVDLARAARPQEDDFTFCVLERRAS